jgi:hypothetical protein
MGCGVGAGGEGLADGFDGSFVAGSASGGATDRGSSLLTIGIDGTVVQQVTDAHEWQQPAQRPPSSRQAEAGSIAMRHTATATTATRSTFRTCFMVTCSHRFDTPKLG